MDLTRGRAKNGQFVGVQSGGGQIASAVDSYFCQLVDGDHDLHGEFSLGVQFDEREPAGKPIGVVGIDVKGSFADFGKDGVDDFRIRIDGRFPISFSFAQKNVHFSIHFDFVKKEKQSSLRRNFP